MEWNSELREPPPKGGFQILLSLGREPARAAESAMGEVRTLDRKHDVLGRMRTVVGGVFTNFRGPGKPDPYRAAAGTSQDFQQ